MTVGKTRVSVRILRDVLAAITRNISAETWEGSYPAMPTIAARAECSESSARRAVRGLESLGILVTVIGGGRKSNDYRLVRPASSEAGPDETGQILAVVEWDDAADDVRIVGADGIVEPEQSTDSARPVSTVSTTDDTTSCTQESFTRLDLDSHQSAPVRPQAAAHIHRIRSIPDDLVNLADALLSRGLRATFSLTPEQVGVVRQVLERVGVSAMVRAAYDAHQSWNPARWWSAWLEIWQGLHVPSGRPERTARTSTTPDSSASAEVPEWALRMARAEMAGKHSTPSMIVGLARTIAAEQGAAA
ncbi:helix-turn-helix domain-containing protein [Frankia sp. CcI49]|uniref:helix-turn-helix domain-containing protein n=1 Tax=Frankia sp. CcI49 TaxID=1745382 RepID=UPI001304423E|nr:helix-turn-helix domain-containing protein [Frankia sp. CcI49]